MIVHFVSTQQATAHDAPVLQRVANIITAEGHELAQPLVDMSSSPRENYTQQTEALARADVVIAEASSHGFNVGYQVSKALHMRKPTLVLSHEATQASQFARGIDTGVEFSEYTEETLEDAVSSFLAKHDVAPKDMRFNFFLTRETFNYLRWAAVKTGKTKAEILRGLVEREIERDRAGGYKP